MTSRPEMQTRNRWFTWKLCLLMLACAAAGWLVIWLPWVEAKSAGVTRAGNPIDGMQPLSLFLLPAIGLVAGLIEPRTGWIAALATMAAFPVIVVGEILDNPTSHNLWPLEFMMYGVLTVYAASPAFVLGWLRRRIGSCPGRK